MGPLMKRELEKARKNLQKPLRRKSAAYLVEILESVEKEYGEIESEIVKKGNKQVRLLARSESFLEAHEKRKQLAEKVVRLHQEKLKVLGMYASAYLTDGLQLPGDVTDLPKREDWLPE